MNPSQLFAAAYVAYTLCECFPFAYMPYPQQPRILRRSDWVLYGLRLTLRVVFLVWSIRVLQGL